MTKVEKEIIIRKLNTIIENIEHLKPFKKLKLEEYQSSFYHKKAVERLLQETIEASIDINSHILARMAKAIPDDYYGTYIKLAEMKILPYKFAREIAPAAGLRNRLVHEYDTLEDDKILESIKFTLRLFPRYVEYINNLIS